MKPGKFQVICNLMMYKNMILIIGGNIYND